MAPDDRLPDEVINEQYVGNEEVYWRQMAGLHGIPLGKAFKEAVAKWKFE